MNRHVTKTMIADAAIAYKAARDAYGSNEVAFESGEIAYHEYQENATTLIEVEAEARDRLFALVDEWNAREPIRASQRAGLRPKADSR